MSRDVHDFGILLGLAYQGFVDQLNAHLAGAGFDDLGRSFGYVFRALLAEHLTATELAERLGMTAQGAAKIVDDMVARNYVERRGDPGDGRARRLYLTARGRRAVTAARRFHADFERRLAESHGANRVATLREILTAALERHAGAADASARPLRPF